MASKHLNITVPTELMEKIGEYRDSMNISRVCQDALYKEVERLDALSRPHSDLNALSPDEIRGIVARVRNAQEHRDKFWTEVGNRYGYQWATSTADMDEILAVITGKGQVSSNDPTNEIDPSQNGRRKQLALSIHRKLAKQARRELSNVAPRFDSIAFDLGVVTTVRQVWAAIASELSQNDHDGTRE